MIFKYMFQVDSTGTLETPETPESNGKTYLKKLKKKIISKEAHKNVINSLKQHSAIN